jgi:hypothetical protein
VRASSGVISTGRRAAGGDPRRGVADPLGGRLPGLGDHAIGRERLAEDGLSKGEHRLRIALVAQRGGGRDRRDAAERPPPLLVGDRRVVIRPEVLERHPQAAQQHGDVGALRAVVGVELIEDEVLQAARALRPQRGVLGAQQQLVEHLVVGEQHVGRLAADDGAVGDEAVLGDLRALRAVLPGVERSRHAGELRLPGEQRGEAAGLVVGERVHRVKHERLQPPHALALGAQDVVEDRQQERLGLARTGAGGDDARLRARALGREPSAGQPCERLGLVAVRRRAGVPVERRPPPFRRRLERQPQPYERALEEPTVGMAEEVGQRGAGVVVGEGEGGA